MANIVIDKAEKRYGAFHAIKGVSIDIEDGEFAVLVGPSGCGKSTLLRMIAGLEAIDAGTVSVDGRVVNDVRSKDRDIAMVFQNYALYPHLNVRKNMAFSLSLNHVPKAQIDERVSRAAGILALEDYLDRYPRQLSGGQRQRVAMGRAIVRDPKAFLFDEPLSNLDAKLRVQMRAEIKALHQQLGTTMVYVTHDQIEAMTMADKIVVLRDGRVEQIGAPLDLYDRPQNVFVAGFIGSPSMNFIQGRMRVQDGRKLFVSEQGIALPTPDNPAVDGQEVTYGIRPEHIAIGPGGVPVRVVVTEPTGSETQVFAKVAGALLDAVVKERVQARAGDEISFLIDAADVHLFDTKTEMRLG